MSKATKRKHVTREVVEEFRLPNEDEKIVKVSAGRGNNLHEVKDHNGTSFLVSMPTKYRKNVWIKRGDFVLVSTISEGDKVKGEITTILYKEQIKHIKAQGAWPEEFEIAAPTSDLQSLDLEDSDQEDDDIFKNTNRPVYDTSEEESSEEEDGVGESKEEDN